MGGSVHEPVHGRGALIRISSVTYLMRLHERQAALRRVVPVSTSSADSDAGKAAPRPGLSVTQLLAAKGTRPIRSLDELAADTFESDEEVEEFLAFTYAERHRDLV